MGKKLKRIIAAATCVIMMSTSVLFAAPMKDVASTHWAYKDIMEMQKRGLMLTSSQGEFFPNGIVTFFEFSQILAKATGYQNAAINPNMNASLKKEISDNYEIQKSVIQPYEKNYKHWQKDANPEIAYLLGKGYIKKEDLGKFMSRSTSGAESKRGVRKQEATAYLVRILHKAKTAEDEYKTTGFVDEAKIEAAYRPYVSYMKKLGIVSGDQTGEFGPTQPITRATLSKMLIATLKIGEKAPEVPNPPIPTDKGIEGKFTKMISKGDGGFYVVLEVEPGKNQTYAIENTAVIIDSNGTPVSLPVLKSKIDLKGDQDINVIAQVDLVGTTEQISRVRIMSGAGSSTPPIIKPGLETEETYTGNLSGKIHSLLIAPQSEITIQTEKNQLRTFEISFDIAIYSELKRKDVGLWDLRLNQQVDLKLVKGEVESLDITKAAPPITLTGNITKVSMTGDQIEMSVSYNSSTQQINKTKTIHVPMETQVLDGTTERGRKDLEKGMEIVVIYGENEDIIPEKIIIIAK